MRISIFLGAIMIAILLSSCSKQVTAGTDPVQAGEPVDIKLLEKAAPQSSALEIYCFDGKNTIRRTVFDEAWKDKVINAVNSLNLTTADDSVLLEWSEPCYGITMGDLDGMEIWLTYSNGLWIEKGGALYHGELDLAALFDEAASLDRTLENTFKSGISMPNSAILAKHFIKYCQKATGDEVTEKDGVSLHFVSIDGNKVTVEYNNNSDKEYLYGDYYYLQKNINGEWYQIPVAFSNYAFNDIAHILNPGGNAKFTCDLTMYGELEAGHYRIVKENLYAEFDKTHSDSDYWGYSFTMPDKDVVITAKPYTKNEIWGFDDNTSSEKDTWADVEVCPQEGSYASIAFKLPSDWDYEVSQTEDVPVSCFVVSIYPKGHSEGSVAIEYMRGFGVCGTGLASEEIVFNGLPCKAWKGTYDNHAYWDFISLGDEYRGCAIINNAGTTWYNDYKDVLEEIISTVVFTMLDPEAETDIEIGSLFEEIMSSPALSSNPGDYMKAHEDAVSKLVAAKDATLRYIFTEFMAGGQTGLKGHIMRLVLDRIAPEEMLDLVADTGQQYFDEWENTAFRFLNTHEYDWLKENHPAMFLLVEMVQEESREMMSKQVISEASFDIDGDGIIEDCKITPGPTSGLFTVVITATVEGRIKYKNTFNLNWGELSFAEKDGKPCILRRTNLGESSETSNLIYVENGRIVIEGLDPDYEGYWGDDDWNLY